MTGQKGFWDVEHRLEELSAEGDPLEKLVRVVDFEIFRPILTQALRQTEPSRIGRPPFCAVLKFKMLVLQSLHGLSLERTTYMVATACRGCGFAALVLAIKHLTSIRCGISARR